MSDITAYYPMITECVVNVLRVIIAIVFAVIITPWLKKSAIPWLKEKQLYGRICKFVRAAEKMAESGTINKEDKLSYVMGLLDRSGIEVTDEVRALIESAVGDLDDVFMQNLSNLAGILVETEPDELEGGEVPDDPDDEAEEVVAADCAACEVG